MRNHYLDALKFIFIIIISFWHTAWWDFLHHGYLPVEFFFIVSGYFIYHESGKNISIKEFSKKKFFRLYPTYIIILIIYIGLSILYQGLYPGTENANMWMSITREATMLKSSGLFELTDVPMIEFNGSAWYVSSFFIGGIVVYLINGSRKLRAYIFSAIAIVFYAWILFFSENGLNGYWGYISIFYIPLWRGIACMGIGSLLGILNESDSFNEIRDRFALSFNCLALISLVVGIICCFVPGGYDWLGILCFIILVLNILQPTSISSYFNKLKYARYVPDISLEILLIHKFTIILTAKIITTLGLLDYSMLKYVMYVLVTVSAAFAIQKFVVPYILRLFTMITTINRYQLR
ncbi:MAG: acyltransferase family protein [Muribaculum sp.]|nr:acyltransferase family protein [Muribaculum sp.]